MKLNKSFHNKNFLVQKMEIRKFKFILCNEILLFKPCLVLQLKNYLQKKLG